MRKTVLLVLLVLNGLMQAVGGLMMIVGAQTAADGMFNLAMTTDVRRLMAVIGGSVLGFLFLSVVSMVWVLRSRREGYDLAVLQGCMLVIVGPIMIATGTAAGGIDAAKGVLIVLCALWARRSLPQAGRAIRAHHAGP